ncbi:MAG TPA: hypothetical protein VGB78_05065 [Thermoplasmata archaeon]|jgi:Na+/melibiose symporter-like transporter
MSIEELILLVIALIVASIMFYVSASIIGHDWTTSGTYVLRIIFVSAISVFVIPLFSDVMGELGVQELGLLFAFVLIIVVVRYLIVDELTVEEDWLASIFIAFIAVVLIFIVDEIAETYFETSLLPLF